MKGGDARFKDDILTPGGVTDGRSSRIDKIRKKDHNDDCKVKIVKIL
jgi:hypothetical protein